MASDKPYVRQEDGETRAFYNSYAPFLDVTPDEIAFFVDAIHQRTGLPTSGKSFPIEIDAIHSAAAAFIDAARSIYEFAFDLESADAGQLDRCVEAHLIGEGEGVPNEPLLYYAMGCFWGDWLVRHRGCAWALYAPLNPIQSFPDALQVSGTACLHPFSQVTKKLADPEGDNLAYKSEVVTADRKVLPPFPLLASLADAERAVRDLLPAKAAAGLDAWEDEDNEKALRLFEKAIVESPKDARILNHGVGCAWELERWDLVGEWLDRLIELCPDRAHFRHNRAVIYTGAEETLPRAIELLESALKLDPEYSRAHITLASCYQDVGRIPEAIKHCKWVIENEEDEEVKGEAKELLKEIRSSGRG